MLCFFNNKKEKGFAALFLAIVTLVIFLGIIINFSSLTLNEHKTLKKISQSSQSYYTAEAGIEDALLRLAKGIDWTNNYTLNIGTNSTQIEISNIIGGARTVISNGNSANQIRKVEAVYAIDADTVSFHYGAQVGAGGMELGSNARVIGNVFSNGNVIASSGTGYINNSIIVAGNGNRIEGLNIGEDATVHTCKDSIIGRDLTYVSGGSVVNCTASGLTKTQPNEISPEPFPISQSQINQWKEESAAGGILTSDYNLVGNSSDSLGPIQIGTPASPKNMTIGNNAVLTIKGTVFVTGNITISNNVQIKLDSSYGPLGGVIISDGKINIGNNVKFQGSGQAGSYLLVISTNNSLDPAAPAIKLTNNAQGAIFYANSGLIYISNNVQIKEVTGYKVKLENNGVITYETGLANSLFSSGPGGGWKVVSWREVQ